MKRITSVNFGGVSRLAGVINYFSQNT